MASSNISWITDAPLVIAHRGASSIAPENTLPAFEKALQMGADAVELDVKLSSDDELVVFHDQTLSRTTNGVGRIADWSWQDLQRLDAGSHHSHVYEHVGIPRLEDVFECLGDRILYNLELTEYNRVATDVTAKTIAMVSKFGLQKQVLYSSFNPLELFRAARFVSSDRIALLVHEKTPPIVRWFVRSLTPHSTYHPYDGLVTEKLVSQTRIKGKRVNVWTVNDEVRMRTLLSWGVDGIITDYPDRAVKLRNELGAINE